MFTHLHVHSHYSLLDGLIKIDDLIKKAKEYKMSSLALTDHGVMYGAIEFYKKAKANGIKPIIGIEAYLSPHSHLEKKAKIDDSPSHLVLLAKNEIGYKNLIKLTTIAHLEGFYYKPRIDHQLLEKYSSGLIALTSCCQGEIPRALISEDFKRAEELIRFYQKIFGQNFYLEIQHHPNLKEQNLVNQELIKLAKKFSLPLVATNDVHYLNSEDAEIQDILLCLQTKKKKFDKDRLSMLGNDFSFRPPEQMETFFKDTPQVILNTEKIASECNLEIKLGQIQLPNYPLSEGLTADSALEKLVLEKFPFRYPSKIQNLEKQLFYELATIKKTGFASYFLIVADFVNWAKKNKIAVGPGRGSAAGSIISYILNITDIDPIKYNLVFERFLNPERIAMPDIDLDFDDRRRDEVIGYIEEKYGKDHVAQIITFGTMAARAAIRDVGRVLDVPYSFCDKLAKMIPFNLSLGKALDTVSELQEIYLQSKEAKKIIDIAKKLEGVARHASKHPCGLIITPLPLDQYLPCQFDVSGGEKAIIAQYEMHSIEDLGLLKIDLLGLKNLTTIEHCLKIIGHTQNKTIDIKLIPLDDQKVFSLLQKGETYGVFQLESDGMRRYLKELKPTELKDIIAMVALYRPGPIHLIPEYIAGKHKRKIPTYLHPKLKPILEKTYGVAVYQEQLLEIARDLAGFSFAEADILRKAVGKKIPELLTEQKEKFISGCLKNQIPLHIAEKIFDFIEPFAGYGFNLAHAACYALIAYQTAYLKANWPTEFMAALLTSDQADIDKIALEIEEAKRMKIEILPPDINESFKNFTVVGPKKIRFGLLAIKNVGEKFLEELIKERQENGVFSSLENFLSRISLNKKFLESLIKSGGLDQFEERGKLVANLEMLLAFNRQKQKDKINGQKTLFSSDSTKTNLLLSSPPHISQSTKLGWEKELLGLYLSEHPLEKFKNYLKKYALPIAKITSISQLGALRIAGIITKIKKIVTSGGQSMLFVKIEDTTGSIEIIVFPKILENSSGFWQENKIILVQGRVSVKEGAPKLIVEKVKEISESSI